MRQTSSGFAEDHRWKFEQRFRETRRKIILATVAFFGFFFASIYLLTVRNDAFRWALLGAWLVSGVALWWYIRTHWRCPACSKRWDGTHVLASAAWDYCPDCGAPLRRVPRGMPATEVGPDRLLALKSEFHRRHRWRKVVIGIALPAVILVMLVAQFHGLGRDAIKIIGAATGSVIVSIIFGLSRCVHCKRGIVMGAQWRCPRCGMSYR